MDLAKAVIDAMAVSYKAKAAYDVAVRHKEIDIVDCASALTAARANERRAELLLREHIDKHKCS